MAGFRPRYADVVATLALVIAGSGMAYAAAHLPKDSVGQNQLQKAAVTHNKIHDDAVGINNVRPQSVTAKDVVGLNDKTTISIDVPAGKCLRYLIDTTTTGAAAGQPAVLTFANYPTPVPAGLLIGPLQVDDASALEAYFCNVSSAEIVLNQQPIHIWTIGVPATP